MQGNKKEGTGIGNFLITYEYVPQPKPGHCENEYPPFANADTKLPSGLHADVGHSIRHKP